MGAENALGFADVFRVDVVLTEHDLSGANGVVDSHRETPEIPVSRDEHAVPIPWMHPQDVHGGLDARTLSASDTLRNGHSTILPMTFWCRPLRHVRNY